MKRRNLPVTISVIAVIGALIGAMAAIVLMSWSHPERPASCMALPVRFVMQDPECAQKLLNAMNVSNVRILEPERFFPGQVSCGVPKSCNGTMGRRD
ncbi:MAG: hypothetical protein NTV86_05125 [Planctomycetota bacterium]|nr:hypothetical protein [Planctomycetota bacterium]